MPFEPPLANGEDNDMLLGLEMDEDINEENIGELIIGDMFMWSGDSPRASPRRDEEPDCERHLRAHAAGHYPADGDHAPVSTCARTYTNALRDTSFE